MVRRHSPWLLILAIAAIGCGDCEGDLPFGGASSRSAQEGVRFVEGERPSADGLRRGRWELRLWIGLWCDRSEAGRAPAPEDKFVFEFDGVEMHRGPGLCAGPTEPPGSPPNGTSFSFTLGEGRHVVRITTPDGVSTLHAFEMDDDSWMIVRHGLDEETAMMKTEISVTHHPLPADEDYDPLTRPGAREEMEWSRRAPGSAGGRRGDGGAGRPAVEVAGSARTATEGDRPDRAALGRSGASSGDGDHEGWIDSAIGYLDIRSVVPARVWLDGRDTGLETPVWGLRMEHGNHRVVLRNAESGLERGFSVDIVGGVTRTLINDETH